MKAPAFWWRRPGLRAILLAPLGFLYGRITARRMARPVDAAGEPPLPVVCVGNFVAGGAGKTPAAIALAGLAREAGLAPVFLTRGHGGRLAGPLIVDPARHSSSEVGDEALLLARVAPTVVARRRRSAFPLLTGSGATLCIMDDGFQNPEIAKTLSLVVVDGATGAGNGFSLPAGPLRAPVRLQLPQAEGLVVYGHAPAGDRLVRLAARAGKPVFPAEQLPLLPEPPVSGLLYAFAGIGRPEKFFDQLIGDGYALAGSRAFADHHAYTEADARAILAECLRLGARPVTTAKDAIRLQQTFGARAELMGATAVFDVACRFATPEALVELLKETRARWLRSR